MQSNEYFTKIIFLYFSSSLSEPADLQPHRNSVFRNATQQLNDHPHGNGQMYGQGSSANQMHGRLVKYIQFK
jgi:hypothetical protein